MDVVQSKKGCPSQKFFYVLFSVTESLFLLGRERTFKKEPPTVYEMEIYTQKYYNSTTLLM